MSSNFEPPFKIRFKDQGWPLARIACQEGSVSHVAFFNHERTPALSDMAQFSNLI